MAKKNSLPVEDPNELVIIGLDTNDGPEHELYDERAMTVLDENLVKNVSVYGILNPIIVREEAGKLLVVDGRQRVRAARQAKHQQDEAGEFEIRVPYITNVVAGADRQRLTGVMISANEQRRADDILVKAAKASRMHALGASLDEVSIAFGRSKTTIRQWFKLLESHPTLLDAVRHELIALSAAHEVAKYDKDQQVAVLRELQKQSKGDRITESLAKAYRQENGDSTASSSHQATATADAGDSLLSPEAQALLDSTAGDEPSTPKPKPKGTKSKPIQSGVKRTWLRKALNTDAAKNLNDTQRGVLQWIATGLSAKGTWWDDFQFEAEAEMEDK